MQEPFWIEGFRFMVLIFTNHEEENFIPVLKDDGFAGVSGLFRSYMTSDEFWSVLAACESEYWDQQQKCQFESVLQVGSGELMDSGQPSFDLIINIEMIY